jgi:hypothetical protein
LVLEGTPKEEPEGCVLDDMCMEFEGDTPDTHGEVLGTT